MKKTGTTILTRSIIAVVLILAIGISISFYGGIQMKMESILTDISKNIDLLNSFNNLIEIEKEENSHLNGYLYRKVKIDNIPYIIKIAKPSLVEILFYAMIPTILTIILSIIVVGSNEKRISKEYMDPISGLIQHLEAFMSGKIDEIDQEELEDFKYRIRELGGNPDHFIESFKTLSENQKIRRDFSANVTHELKSPLTSINGYAEMIATGITDKEDTIRFASIINKEGVRLLNMINEIIQLSKFDTGALTDSKIEKFRLLPLLDDILTSMDIYIKESNVKVTCSGKDLSIYGYKVLIEECFRNLISNAIKYKRGIRSFLDILVYEKDDDVYIEFKDNGIGIKKEDQKRVFERFFVVNESRNRKTGTGLGLSLVKHIVVIHHGRLELESEFMKGSTFTIILPKNLKEILGKEEKRIEKLEKGELLN